jgi:hypothetical protein
MSVFLGLLDTGSPAAGTGTSQAGALDIVALVIAVIGLCLSLVALVWVAVSWRYTRDIVRVTLSRAIVVGATNLPTLSVTASNVGRSAVSIEGWGLLLPDGQAIWPAVGDPSTWWGSQTPITLQGGHSEFWQVDLNVIRNAIVQQGLGNVQVRGFVNLGTGRKRKSKTLRP